MSLVQECVRLLSIQMGVILLFAASPLSFWNRLHPGLTSLAQGHDSTVRIWSSHEHKELAKLSYSTNLVSVAWMDGDTGVVCLAEDGVIGKWTRVASDVVVSLSH